MAHRGKGAPYFFWRDLCGEFAQGPSFSPYRNIKFQRYGKHSPFADWLALTQPVSLQGQRVDWEPDIYWDWNLSPHHVTYQSMRWRVTWDALARTVYSRWELIWDGGSAQANRLWQQPPAVYPVSGFTLPMLWDYSTTTDPDVWSWGSGSIETLLQTTVAQYSEIPDP